MKKATLSKADARHFHWQFLRHNKDYRTEFDAIREYASDYLESHGEKLESDNLISLDHLPDGRGFGDFEDSFQCFVSKWRISLAVNPILNELPKSVSLYLGDTPAFVSIDLASPRKKKLRQLIDIERMIDSESRIGSLYIAAIDLTRASSNEISALAKKVKSLKPSQTVQDFGKNVRGVDANRIDRILKAVLLKQSQPRISPYGIAKELRGLYDPGHRPPTPGDLTKSVIGDLKIGQILLESPHLIHTVSRS